ncbi:hypothetical protein PHYBLDRAFT_165653 [Phycomyces blakesleeanus NRRL 1555(-)]|uniref:F-box domain-containing protein n=2 Tax=Phycomyces blakesleeanus TaxID=4837 RepID=A0A162UQR6_PHYB8|nr:hypothetical protein PHYBLDRAFT_165653 [Phycomyces blakesleeanus NRRL 1555(-)]OAD77163.1 hypothetical protein PHYBLDRAFT_165653 [Phycomyces blakesleeanus NRRL 1555(-)]|eukprot:XP_018295203.1 hypothetical protein PHYBLDRAFT_165653 [Phycomyces blakesleeanus NRRL 1555(-)]
MFLKEDISPKYEAEGRLRPVHLYGYSNNSSVPKLETHIISVFCHFEQFAFSLFFLSLFLSKASIMTPSDLPPDILTRIADYLSEADKSSCAISCKGWVYPFQKALWKDMHAYSFETFKETFSIIKATQNESVSPGAWVHNLCIYDCFVEADMSDIQVIDMIRCMPNLKYLCLKSVSYEDLHPRITMEDIRAMMAKARENASLTLGRNENKDMHSGKYILEFINTCTMLQKLEIRADKPNYYIALDVTDFDSMHQSLQELSSFKAGISLCPDFLATLDIIPNTTPAFSMTSIDINLKKYKYENGNGNTNKWNPLWLYYFGYKYPNLRSLKLNILGARHESIDPDQRQKVISLFHSNPNALKHLETFKFVANKTFESFDLILWELLYPLRVPIKHLTLSTGQDHQSSNLYTMHIGRILQSFSGTLNTLSVTGFTYNDNHQIPAPKLFPCCQFLTDLCIYGRGGTFNMDDILNKCVALKHLKLLSSEMFVNLKTKNGELKQQHGLQTLDLHRCSITSEVFNHISLRCRSLQHMSLCEVWITGSFSQKNGCLLLDMTHTFLKTLHVEKVKYGTSHQEMQRNEENIISMTLLSRLNDPSLSDVKDEIEKVEIGSKYQIAAPQNIAWIFSYEFEEIPSVYIVDRTDILDEEGADIARKYYQDFQLSKTQTLESNKPSHFSWIGELYKGYGEFRCGDIEEYTTD